MIDNIIKLIADSFMKVQSILNRVLIAAWVWFSFYLNYKDSLGGSPDFADMLFYIIRFFTRPIEYIIDKLFYT